MSYSSTRCHSRQDPERKLKGSAVNRRALVLGVAAAIGAIVFGLAYALAPRACEGGFDLYVWSGIAALVALFALPFVARVGHSVAGSIGWAFGLTTFGLAVWIAGLVTANVFVLCRLF